MLTADILRRVIRQRQAYDNYIPKPAHLMGKCKDGKKHEPKDGICKRCGERVVTLKLTKKMR